jgi:hypothetical protein
MTPTEFEFQMARLSKAAGRAVTPEKKVLIWDRFKQYLSYQLSAAVDHMIGEDKKITLSEMELAFAFKREQRYRQTKAQLQQDSADFWSSRYHSDEVKQIVDTIKRRLAGQVGDAEYASFVNDLKTVADRNEADARKKSYAEKSP